MTGCLAIDLPIRWYVREMFYLAATGDPCLDLMVGIENTLGASDLAHVVDNVRGRCLTWCDTG